MLLLLAVAVAMAATAPRPSLDLGFERGTGSHASVDLGFASVRLAFDSGQKCSNSNGCASAPL